MSNDNTIPTDDALAEFLYRVEDRDGYFHGAVREVQAKQDIELIGVATRYGGDRFKHDSDRERFESNLDRLANDVVWFDEPIDASDDIAVYLYRWDLGNRDFFAATRRVQQFADKELIGIATRPKQQTVGNSDQKDVFLSNVADVATITVLFIDE
jgi:hypothetical protein